MPNIVERFRAAKYAGMKLVGFYAGMPLFDGSEPQFALFHQYLGTPSL